MSPDTLRLDPLVRRSRYRAEIPAWLRELGLSPALEKMGFPGPRQDPWRHTPLSRWLRTPRKLLQSSWQENGNIPGNFLWKQNPSARIVASPGTSWYVARGQVTVNSEDRSYPWILPTTEWFAYFTAEKAIARGQIHWEKGTLHILHLYHGKEAVVVPHWLMIDIPAGRSVQIVEEWLDISDQADEQNAPAEDGALLCSLTELHLGEGAAVDWVRVFRKGSAGVLLDYGGALLEKESSLRLFTISLDVPQMRSLPYILLRGTGSKAFLYGRSIPVHAGMHHEHYPWVVHLAENTQSRQEYRGFIPSRAELVFQGTIFVYHSAQKTDAFQESRWIPGGDSARIVSRPQLVIFADDVRCTHGSTTGIPFRDEIHYMRTRGISEVDARFLLYRGFLALPEAETSEWFSPIHAELESHLQKILAESRK